MEFSRLSELMRENGVVGAGGAGFPSYAKLNKEADTVILNCAECEPLLKLHRQVLENYSFEILSAFAEVMKAVGAKNGIIAIKKSYSGAIDSVNSNLDSFKNIKIGLLPEVYPSGDEVLVIYETTGRRVEAGKLPISVGCIVYNVETMLNTYYAIKNIPVTHKYITVAGEVENPVTLKVPIGISLKEVVKQAGKITCRDYQYFVGGPMTGRLGNEYETVTKTTNAIIILPKNHSIIQKKNADPSIDLKRAMAACCQCQMCTDLCSRNLVGHPIEPHMFMRYTTNGVTKDVKPYLDTFYCSNCGICELYACFQNLSPRSLIQAYKAELQKKGIKPENPVTTAVKKERNYRTIPMKRLVQHLGLTKYNVSSPLDEKEVSAKRLKIALSQSIGDPSTPIIKIGDSVVKGQKIADFDDKKLGVALHSPVNGIIEDINDKFIVIKTN